MDILVLPSLFPSDLLTHLDFHPCSKSGCDVTGIDSEYRDWIDVHSDPLFQQDRWVLLLYLTTCVLITRVVSKKCKDTSLRKFKITFTKNRGLRYGLVWKSVRTLILFFFMSVLSRVFNI